MKRVLSLLLALVMVVSLLPTIALAADIPTSPLTEDWKISETVTITGDVTIDGNGYKITYADGFTGTLFKIEAGGSLTLKNVTIDGGNNWTWNEDVWSALKEKSDGGGSVTDAEFNGESGEGLFSLNASDTVATDSLIKVSGTLNMQNCTVQNYFAKKQAGAVWVETNGVANLLDTKFTHGVSYGSGTAVNAYRNTNLSLSLTNVEISDCFGAGNGATLTIGGAGSDQTNAVLENCNIHDNRAINSNGVVVMTRLATLTMSGGSIKNNIGLSGHSNHHCAMIYAHTGGKFVMNGGEIVDNTGCAEGGVITNGSSSAALILNSGTIKNNSSNDEFMSNMDVGAFSNTTIGADMEIGNIFILPGVPVSGNGTISGDLVAYEGTTVNIDRDKLLVVNGTAYIYTTTEEGKANIVNGLWMNRLMVNGQYEANGKSFLLGGMLTGILEGAANVLDETFVDVSHGAYYYNAVEWAYNKGIAGGVDSKHFAPDESCTRAQAVTMLYRAAGCPDVWGENPFVDVDVNDYYYEAVLWAVANGITSGTDATHFSPDEACTRGQIVTFLHRAARCYVAHESFGFADVKTGSYCEDAVNWAVENAITNGTGVDTFSPDDVCTRAQIVTFLYRNR